MTDSTAIEDILSQLGGMTEAPKAEDIEELITPEEPLVSTDWTLEEEGGSTHIKWVLFSELFWEPTHVPDHLVPCFKGYDSDVPKELYIPNKHDFEWLSFSISMGAKANVVGPTGCGKTLMFEYYAAITGRPCLRIEHNQELDKATVFGQVHITEGDTDFVPGMFVVSAAAPTLVILDEVSRAPGGANMIYKRAMDRGEIYVPEMKDAGARAVKPHPQWVLCGTDNTKGDGEDMDKYPMSNVQDAAFRNAWDIMLLVDYLAKVEEAELIKGMAPRMGGTQVAALANFSHLMHTAFKTGDINTAFSPRQLSTICDCVTNGVAIKDAVEKSFVNFCSKSEVSDVRESYRAAFGGSL
jgi:MoxR-like ATPase